MLLRSETPSPVDEFDPYSPMKRQRLTTFTLEEHARPEKRKLPSFLQSPIEEDEVADARTFTKRQRCTTLENGIERLSLTPPIPPAPAPAVEFTTLVPAPALGPDLSFASSSSAPWLGSIPAASCSAPAPYTTTTMTPPVPLTPAAPASARFADAIEDVKMRSSSWYEPEKDRACPPASLAGPT